MCAYAYQTIVAVFALSSVAACGGSNEGPQEPAADSTRRSNAAPFAANDQFSVSPESVLRVAAPGLLANDTDADGNTLTARVITDASRGTLSLERDGSFSYTPTPGFTGADTFTYMAGDGTLESAAATVTITVSQRPILFTDRFSRASGDAVGNDWSEVEAAGASAALSGGRLTFADTADVAMRPLVTHSFPAVTTGSLEWEFELDWTRIGSDDTYAVHMQLGDGTKMTADSPNAGVAVHLVWTRIGALDQALGYRQAGGTTALSEAAGLATVRVHVDRDALAYDVYVDGRLVGSQIPLELPVALNAVRFFASGLTGTAFAGRAFDSVTVSGRPSGGGAGDSPPIAHESFVRAADGLEQTITLAYTDSDGPGPYRFDIVDLPQHGTLRDPQGDATVVYTPSAGFIGSDTFTFRVNDGLSNSNTAAVTVFVQHYPGATWETRTPAEAGLDAATLDRLAARIGGVGSIVRHGYMVKTWGDQTAKADWASTSKPVMNTLLFFAVHENRISALEDPIEKWVLAGTGATLRAEDKSMTFSHLMNMTSGYATVEPPGAAWAYNDFAVNLKNRLTGAIFGEPLDAPLRARLGPLQLEDGALMTTRGGYGVSTTTRDFARVAWFWLNRGNWRGEQILPEELFDRYMKTQVPGTMPRTTGLDVDYLNVGTAGGGMDQSEFGPGQFGMSWWFNDTVGTTGLRPFPDSPLDMIQAHGHWGREMIVMIPSLNLVVATRGTWGSFVPGDASSGVNERLRLLTSAVR
jgi:hypothetical protein